MPSSFIGAHRDAAAAAMADRHLVLGIL